MAVGKSDSTHRAGGPNTRVWWIYTSAVGGGRRKEVAPFPPPSKPDAFLVVFLGLK